MGTAYRILLGRLGVERLAQLGRNPQHEDPESGPRADCLWFEITRHNVCNQEGDLGFKAYWETHGLSVPGLDAYGRSLQLFGLPLTAPRIETNSGGHTVLTQWFERARFELHPQFAGTPYEVELSLLGNQATYDQQEKTAFQPVASFPATAEAMFFPQTGHGLSLDFKRFWEANGALPIFGYPISEVFQQQNPSDGQSYNVQYFERARFEYHPANPPDYQVELGLLGHQLIATALPVKQVNVTVVAGTAQTTVGLDQTALVVSGASEMTVAIQFPEPVNPAVFHVQLHQIPGRDAWQVAPASRTPGLSEYVFDLQGGVDRPDYLRIDVTRGVGNPALVFGIQVGSGQATPALLTDWNNPIGLLQSYYNAINRHEYARAYSYWETPGTPNGVTPIFKDFVRGYANVASVEITTGTILSDAGAGNIGYQVPTVISAIQADGTIQRFYGCYLLHRTQVPIDDTLPPYTIALRAAHISIASASAAPARLLEQANALVQGGQCTQ